MSTATYAVNESARISAPARLHLGFLDLQGGLGRRFGSLGLALEGLATRLTVYPAAEVSAAGPAAARAASCARAVLERLGLAGGVHVALAEAIPEHMGLGSGTQLSLAVGIGVARLYGLDCTAADLARLTGRGARSGIGIGAFEQGGFLVDGGHGAASGVPPIVSRVPFPAHWRAVLVLDTRRPGLHGSAEREAFRSLPPFPPQAAAHICRLVLMQVLPALVESDIDAFGRGITQIQTLVGDHFAPAQGGRFASPAVAAALEWFRSQGVAGVGQSSWGPTGFALVGSEDSARELVRTARAHWGESGPLRFQLCEARNRGGEIEVRGAALRARS
jgi:beta-ribofuranosylaminobenzene 5'-phosphate synthase